MTFVTGGTNIIKDNGGSFWTKPSRKVTSSTYNLIGVGDSQSIITGSMTKSVLQLVSESLFTNRSIICTFKPFGLDGYSWNYTYSLGPILGQTLTTLLPSQVFSEFDPTMTNIVVACAGTNGMFTSLGNHSAATEFADWQTFRALVLATGLPAANFIVETVLPRQSDSAFNTKRLSYNTSLATDAANFGFKIADSGAANHLGTSGDETNATYYQDQIHTTDTGNAIRAALVVAQIP